MSSPEKLRAQAKELYQAADKIEHGDARLSFILLAMRLETEADVLERGGTLPNSPAKVATPHVAQQQQQPQPDDDKE